MFCPSCGAQFAAPAAFCPQCGKPQPRAPLPASPASQRSTWWTRNWKWAAPAGCLTLLLLLSLFIISIFAVVMGSIKSSEVYQQSLARARASAAVVEKLGEPIEPGWLISGSISVSGPSGEAQLAIPISGPKGKGKIYLDAEKRAGIWEFSTLEVAIEGQTERIKLLETSPQF